jgi:hypothetical protein
VTVEPSLRGAAPYERVLWRGVGRDWDTRIRTTELTTEDSRGERAGTCVFRWWVVQVTVTLHSTRTPLREQAPPAPPPRSLSRSIECASATHNRNTSARRMWSYHSEDEMRERNGQSRRARRNMSFRRRMKSLRKPPSSDAPRGQRRPAPPPRSLSRSRWPSVGEVEADPLELVAITRWTPTTACCAGRHHLAIGGVPRGEELAALDAAEHLALQSVGAVLSRCPSRHTFG